jgi:outer membrane autotransporter protein
VEASARAGKADTDFKSNLRDGFGRSAEYDTKTGYLGGHVGVGYVLNLNERSKLDLYAQYLWSRQNDDKVKLTTGETVKFSAVDSQRTRLGAKWLYPLSQQTSAYVGAAWEHEYDGKAKASIYGYKLDAPKLRGDTGMAEIGFHLTPTQNKALTLDIGVQAHTGKREGVTGSLQVKWAF